MPNFAIINGRVVGNIIVADDLETATEIMKNTNMGELAVQIPKVPNSPGIGWEYDGTNFIPPVVSTPQE